MRGVRRTLSSAIGTYVALCCATTAGAETRSVNYETRAAYTDIKPRPTPEETYVANALSVVDLDLDSQILFWHASESTWHVVRGSDRRQTSYSEFFQALGRKDLARDYDDRSTTGQWCLWGGVAASAAGVGLGLYGLAREQAVPAIIGGSMLVGGLVVAQIGFTMQNPSISAEDATRLVNSYNANLRMYLRLPEMPSAALHPASSRRRSMAVAPLLAPGVAGLSLGFRF